MFDRTPRPRRMNFQAKSSELTKRNATTCRGASLPSARSLMAFYFISLFACTLESDSSSAPVTKKPPVTPQDSFSWNAPDTVNPPVNPLDSLCTPISRIETAFADRAGNITVTVKGTVTKILSDDTVGDRHQRFIIALSNGQTLLIVHNVDIATRVSGLSAGVSVYVHGDYLWNDQGGLIHWTHRDPDNVHENGWIVFKNKRFE